MQKEKICPICQAFTDKNYLPEMVLHINKLIKSKQPTEVLNKQSGLVFSDYRYKTHREKCLINFEIPFEEQKIKLDKENDNKFYNQSSIDISSIITNFRSMNIEEKQSNKNIKMMEIEYLIINIVHHQLVNGLLDNSVKGIIPKDDINSLKIINEVMRKNDIEIENVKPEFSENKEKASLLANSLLDND